MRDASHPGGPPQRALEQRGPPVVEVYGGGVVWGGGGRGGGLRGRIREFGVLKVYVDGFVQAFGDGGLLRLSIVLRFVEGLAEFYGLEVVGGCVARDSANTQFPQKRSKMRELNPKILGGFAVRFNKSSNQKL